MRYLVFICCLAAALAAQAQQYHRVKVNTGKDGMAALAAKGVAVDHGEYKRGNWFIGEFSDAEMKLIDETGLAYEILISDMAKYYADRSKNAQKSQVATACKNCKTYPVPSNFALGSMGGFYTYAEMLAVLDSMAAKFPNLITVKQPIDTAQTFEGRQLLYVKISDNPTANESEPEMLYTALHHAREPESLTQLIYYMWFLLENYSTNAEVTYLVDNLEIYFVPCVNPDGYVYNETTNPGGGGMWRKNRRDNGDGSYGVDLNRNYGYQWGYDNFGSSPNTGSDTYRGSAPFSEAETQMMMRFCNAHTFALALNNHTFSNVLVQPYGYGATAYTPDSLLFVDFGMKLTYCDGFTYGSAQQTVGYTANGVSDDWMYGEQTSKPKIYAMTPEAGSTDDGFWPAYADITPIAQNTLDQNINAARLVSVYAEVKSTDAPFVQQSGYLTYTIRRMGLQAGSFTVSVMPLSGSFQTVGAANTHSALTHLQSVTDSISFSLVGSVTPGTVIQYLLSVNNGGYTLSDTITRVFGYPITVFSDDCSATAQWTGTTWGTTTLHAVSPTKSITDSPSGYYGTNINKTYTTVSNINLTTALAAYLEYYARWELEKNWDYVEIQVSANGGAYTPLCAPYTHAGNSSQNNGAPLYDGFQRSWVKERIDLSAYLGQNIKLRFNIVSDGGVEYDGFYFEDVRVEVLDTNATGAAASLEAQPAGIFPNPSAATVTLVLGRYSAGHATAMITDVLGKRIMKKELPAGVTQATFDLRAYPEGVYFITVANAAGSQTLKLVIARS